MIEELGSKHKCIQGQYNILMEVLAEPVKTWLYEEECGLKACKVEVPHYVNIKLHISSVFVFVPGLLFAVISYAVLCEKQCWCHSRNLELNVGS
jgi:hypothetical protein